MKLKIDDRYSIVLNNNPWEFYATRYGEKWRDLTGDNLVLAMVHKLEESQELLKENQYSGFDGNDHYCATCGSLAENNHTKGCRLAKLLNDLEVN